MSEFPGVTFIGPCAARFGPWPKRYVVWHYTFNTASPQGEASYAMRRTDGVGMHFAVNPTDIVQCLATDMSTGHVGSRTGNRHGISVEQVGGPWSTVDYWRKVIDKAAPTIAAVCRKWAIPPAWLSIEQLRDGTSKGFCTHDDARLAWGGTTHTDPGPLWPRDYASRVVRDILFPPMAPGIPTVPRGVRVLRLTSPQLRGTDVAFVQRYIGPAHCGTEDGIYGPHTESGVRWYQQLEGIQVDGIVGRQTWTKMGVHWMG